MIPGSLRTGTGKNGAVISKHDYHPFGEETTGAGDKRPRREQKQIEHTLEKRMGRIDIMGKTIADRKKIVVSLTAAFLFCLSLSAIPVFSQCNFSRSNTNKTVAQLLKCLEIEKKDLEIDIFTRQQTIFGLHKLGKEAIPNLIANISNSTRVLAMLDNPRSSDRRGNYIPVGLISAFIIELILSKETLVNKKEDFGLAILGSTEENYPYWDGDIRNSGNKFIKAGDLPEIREIYQAWWEKNKNTPVDVLREMWKNGDRILDGKEYRWT